MTKPIKVFYSTANFLKSLFTRILFGAAICYLASVSNENPPVIGILIAFCSVVIFFWGNDEILIYTDRVVKKSTSLFRMFKKSKKNIVYFRDVRNIDLSTWVPPRLNPKRSVFSMAPEPGRSDFGFAQLNFSMKFGDDEVIITDMTLYQGRAILETLKTHI